MFVDQRVFVRTTPDTFLQCYTNLRPLHTNKTSGLNVGLQVYRQLLIAMTETPVRRICQPFSLKEQRYDRHFFVPFSKNSGRGFRCTTKVHVGCIISGARFTHAHAQWRDPSACEWQCCRKISRCTYLVDTAKMLTSLLSGSSSVSSPALPASEPATEVSVGTEDATVVETAPLAADEVAVAL